MKIEIVMNIGNTKEPYTYTVFVDDEVKYSNLSYEELITVTIGDLDRYEDIDV